MASKQREISRVIEKLESKKSLLEASIFDNEKKLKDVRWKITQEYINNENVKLELNKNTIKSNSLNKDIQNLNNEIGRKEREKEEIDIYLNNFKKMEQDYSYNISILKADLIAREEEKEIITTIIENINNEINHKEEEIENLSVQLWLYREDLYNLQNTISEEKQVLQTLKKEYTKVDNNRQILDKKESDLIKRERDIILKEKRLDTLEQSLFSKKK